MSDSSDLPTTKLAQKCEDISEELLCYESVKCLKCKSSLVLTRLEEENTTLPFLCAPEGPMNLDARICSNCGFKVEYGPIMDEFFETVPKATKRFKQEFEKNGISSFISDGYLYHATLREGWFSSMQNSYDGGLLFHSGNLISALSLVESRYYKNFPPYFLWKLKLKDSIPFAITPDVECIWPEEKDDIEEFFDELDEEGRLVSQSDPLEDPEKTGVLYLNEYEAPGYPSFLLNSSMIETAELVEKISRR